MSSWFKSKISAIKEWYSSQDTQQNITVITSFASDAFKVVMASLLCVFVPQACTIEESNKDIFTFPDAVVMDDYETSAAHNYILYYHCEQYYINSLCKYKNFISLRNMLRIILLTVIVSVKIENNSAL